MKAWHFLPTGRKLRWGSCEVVKPGVTLKHDGPLVLCRSGFHASRKTLDALGYAPGPVACRVDIGGKIVDGGDKLVASERTVVWMYDATDVLRHFARLCALDVIHLWDAPDVVLRYLRTGDETLQAAAWAAAWAAARAAARDAACDAAWAAARDAARDAACDAAWAAARDAARDAAWAAARDAARDAACDAARAAQSRRLARMLNAGRKQGEHHEAHPDRP